MRGILGRSLRPTVLFIALALVAVTVFGRVRGWSGGHAYAVGFILSGIGTLFVGLISLLNSEVMRDRVDPASPSAIAQLGLGAIIGGGVVIAGGLLVLLAT